jgi:acyl CoA:acetate/3-ketoacid CoA transferase alpha subunit
VTHAEAVSSKVVALADLVAREVRAGDALHVFCGHTRWNPAATEVIRQWWGRDPGFELSMLSLSSLGTLWFRGGLVRRVITGYSGDVFPNFTPNPIFGEAYLSGRVEVQHWSFLTFAQRLEAAARGLPAVVTGSLVGSDMAANDGFTVVDGPHGPVGLLDPYAPDVALVHAAVADRAGNLAFHPPLLEGLWGALAARRGVIATAERIVEDLRPWSHLVKVPGHRTLGVAECRFGAHPGGLYGTFTAAEPYGEDLAFWEEVRNASRTDGFDDWIRRWVLEVPDHDAYLARLGADRLAALSARADPASWRDDEAAHPPDLDAPVNDWERAAVHGARVLAERILTTGADAALAGAGVANLAAWLGVRQARAAGSGCVLTAELGLWAYEPTPADPFVFNHRAFPSAVMLSDASDVLGTVVRGPGTRTIGCLGAALVDREGNIDSTVIPGRAFLVGSGGGNDVASGADEVVVVTTLTPRRTMLEVPYITSPGDRVSHLVTDLGVFTRRDGRLVLTAVSDTVEAVTAVCGWEVEVADDLDRLPPVTLADVEPLRRWDPRGLFLRG